MKKSLIPLLAILILNSLASCSSSPSVITIPYGSLYDSSLTGEEHFQKDNYSSFLSYINKEDTFFLAIRGSDANCVCWSNVRDNLSNYAKKTNLLIHYMSLSDFDGREEKGLNLVKDEQTIAVFEKGKIAYQFNIQDGSDLMWKYDSFAEKLNERIKVGSILKINKSQLDKLYEGDTPFVVTFSRSTCPDCGYLESHHLRDLAVKDYRVSYLFDCDSEGVRLFNGASPKIDGNEDEKQAYSNWITFKDQYGLSDKNSVFGYKEGYVPTITFNLPGLSSPFECVKDAFVWGNETVTKTGDDYLISDSYFSDEIEHDFLSDKTLLEQYGISSAKIEGRSVNQNEVNESASYLALKHETSSSLEDPLLSVFFDFYLGK